MMSMSASPYFETAWPSVVVPSASKIVPSPDMMATGRAISSTMSRERALCLRMSRTANRVMRRRWDRPRATTSPESRTVAPLSGVFSVPITTPRTSGCG